MWISCFKFSRILIFCSIILAILLCFFSCYFFLGKTSSNNQALKIHDMLNFNNINHLENNNAISFGNNTTSLQNNVGAKNSGSIQNSMENKNSMQNNVESQNSNSTQNTEDSNVNTEEKSYIKWFEFKPTYDILVKTSKLDIDSHVKNEDIKYNWIELISYLACKYGNDFKKFKQADLDNLVKRLKNGETMEEITKNMKLYSYYFEGYNAVLAQFIGDYQIQKPESTSNNEKANNEKNSISNNTISGSNNNIITNTELSFTEVYGIKAFHPLAQNYSYSHYDDFGNSRSYGYKRLHFGNDLMGSIGTPVVAVESGIVEAVGWNQYGGWRVGIRSFDQKRYYYYAHLRKGHPYAKDLCEGKIVSAGDVIGYLGMTGYSTKEDVNNINVPHLHFGIQLIFDEVQKEGPNQIWVDVYNLIDFLKKNRSTVFMNNKETKDYVRKYEIIDPSIPD